MQADPHHPLHEQHSVHVLDGPGCGPGEVFDQAFDHFVPLVVLEVHHLVLVVLSEGLDLVDSLLPLAKKPLPCLM